MGALSLLGVWKHFSSSLTIKGRLIAPILQTRNDQPYLQQKIGVFADSLESTWNNSITIYGNSGPGLKLELGFSYTDIGSHGLVKLYQEIHNKFGSPTKESEFGERLKESFRSSSYGAFLILPLGDHVNAITGVSVLNSRAFKEESIEGSVVVSLSRRFALSFKYSYVEQDRSSWYELLDYRQQYLVGMRLSSFWTPSLMYVTPYVEGDHFGQVYFSPIAFTFPF